MYNYAVRNSESFSDLFDGTCIPTVFGYLSKAINALEMIATWKDNISLFDKSTCKGSS